MSITRTASSFAGCSSSPPSHTRSPRAWDRTPRPYALTCTTRRESAGQRRAVARCCAGRRGLRGHGRRCREGRTRLRVSCPMSQPIMMSRSCSVVCRYEPTLNNACKPFSAACSSSRFFSSGERFPALSAACICSKTFFSSIADRKVETLCGESVSGWYRVAKILTFR